MEPISLTIATLVGLSSSFVGDFVKNRFDEVCNKYLQSKAEELKKLEKPVNGDLQKAVLCSHWFATKIFLDELKKNAPNKEVFSGILWLLDEQIGKIKDEKYIISPDSFEVDLMIQKQHSTTLTEPLKQKVIDFHLAELEKLLINDKTVFETLKNAIKNGLTDLDWFELVCAFLNELLKGDNNKAKDAFQNQELAKIGLEVAEIKQVLAGFGQLTQGFISNIGEQRFEEFKALLKEDLAEIKNSLNRIEEGIEHLKKGQDEIKDIITGNFIPKTPKELTLKIPKIHPSEVIGRETELADLHKLLFANKQVVVVNGLGGIGKTTLAQAYLSQYYDSYEHIAWISQSAENAIMNDFINAEGLKESLNIKPASDDLQQIFMEILQSLKALPAKPNLLLIDNAESNLSQLVDYLPHQPNWHLLVTSRESIERFYMKELGFLSPEKALELFRTHCKLIHDEVAIKDLLKTIDYHTLTIEILAKTAQKQHTNITKLKTAIETDLKAGVYIKHKGEKIEKVFSYLASIFDLSKLNTYEVWLMKQVACLPAEFISFEQLIEYLSPEGEYEENFAETLAELVAKGWILANTETDSYKMHRIIAEVAAQKLGISVEDVENLIENITQKLRIDQTKDNPIDKFQWIPYGRAILANFEHETDNKIAILQNNLATVLKDLGDYEGAKELLEKAKKSDEKNLGEEHPTTAVSYSNLATVLQDLGDYEGAKELLEKAKKSDEKNFGEEHPTTAVRYSNLALVLQDLGDYEGAKELLEKAKKSAEKNFGEEHPTTAVRYSNLATVLQDLGDYEGAKELLEKAKKSAEKNFGEEHPTTAVRYSNLALVLQDLRDYEGAKELLEKAKKSAEKNFGEEHPTTAVSYSNLATVLKDLGDYEGAKELLEKAKKSDEKNFGEEHPTTAVRYSNLALVLKDLGDYEGAKELLEKAKKSAEKNFGEEHPSTARTYSNLATTFYYLNDFENAVILLEKAYKVYRNLLGEQHPSTKTIKGNLDFVRRQMQ